MTTPRLTLAALLAAFAAAGCGSSDSPSADDAKPTYEPLSAEVAALGRSAATAVVNAKRSTNRELLSTFPSLAERGRATIARLDQLDVPDDLDDERRALRDALDKGIDDLDDLALAAKVGDPDAAYRAAAQLTADSPDIRSARAALDRAFDDATK